MGEKDYQFEVPHDQSLNAPHNAKGKAQNKSVNRVVVVLSPQRSLEVVLGERLELGQERKYGHLPPAGS